MKKYSISGKCGTRFNIYTNTYSRAGVVYIAEASTGGDEYEPDVIYTSSSAALALEAALSDFDVEAAE